ncbi:MAG TPA: Gfo/Idh/MocA family oxidoreductase [Acidimicrobiales bacterium]|nr:Gfo/Idh/MocA family oxidoreductase [Acidimicrobiales bacterium]
MGSAVVGLGIGTEHVRAMRRQPERFQVRAVCDPDDTRSTAVAERIGADVQPLDEILRRDDIDLVALCTPPHLHREQIEQVLAAGKHCVCEKPLVATLAHLDELEALERASAGSLMPVFNYRYGHGLQRLKLLIDRGLTGRLYSASMILAWRRRAAYYSVPWRGKKATELGGILLSHAVHGLDAFLYLLGPPAAVVARTATLVNPIETEDTAAAILEMPDGALITVSATLGSAEEMSQHRFAFERVSAASGLEPYTFTDDPWTFTPDTEDDRAAIDEALAGYVPRRDGWTGQYERLADALDAGERPPVTIDDARAVIELVLEMYGEGT